MTRMHDLHSLILIFAIPYVFCFRLCLGYRLVDIFTPIFVEPTINLELTNSDPYEL